MAYATKQKGTYGNLAYAQPEVLPHPNEYQHPRPKERKRQTISRPHVRVREQGKISLFGVIGLIAALLLSTMVIYSYAELAMTNDGVIQLKQELSDLEVERLKLLAQYELAFDLGTVEAKVMAEGSMVKPQSSQIFTVDMMEGDSVVHYGNLGEEEPDWLSICVSYWNKFKAYFQS